MQPERTRFPRRPHTVMLPSMRSCMFQPYSTSAMVGRVKILLAGLLPNAQVSTDTTGISRSICSLAYEAPLGLASAASTRVSNALGAKR